MISQYIDNLIITLRELSQHCCYQIPLFKGIYSSRRNMSVVVIVLLTTQAFCPGCVIRSFYSHAERKRKCYLTRSQASWHVLFLFCWRWLGCVLALCRFEESLGSSNVVVSMVTEGFPHYFLVSLLQCAVATHSYHHSLCVCVCFFDSA